MKEIHEEYERILHSNQSEEEKCKEYARLMTEMEKRFHIPVLRDEKWERENKAVIALYRKISMSRDI